jgi:hypothetical protein
VTFEAPGFPEPKVEMSIPLARAMRIALGNVPMTYAIGTRRNTTQDHCTIPPETDTKSVDGCR